MNNKSYNLVLEDLKQCYEESSIMLASTPFENNSFDNINLSLSNISDDFFSQCPEEESEYVLFCYFLSSQQWEQVRKFVFLQEKT